MPRTEWTKIVKPYQEKLARINAEMASLQAIQLERAQETQRRFEQSRDMLAQGEIADGGEGRMTTNRTVHIYRGDVIFLSITPLNNHGADTTKVELEIKEVAGKRREWSVRRDLLDNLLAGNPHPDPLGNKQVWWLFDTRNQPTLLPEAVPNLDGKPGLLAWRNGDTPSVLVNSSKEVINAWTKLPGQSLFVHPSPNGNVGVAWLSPIDGEITISGQINDAHPGGPDGVGWILEHFATDARQPLADQAKCVPQLRERSKQRDELQRSAPREEYAYGVVEGTARIASVICGAIPKSWARRSRVAGWKFLADKS